MRARDYIITQMFFDNRDLYDCRDRCEMSGIRIPIVAGIMPIQSVAGMKKMSELAQGMRFPAPLMRMVRRTDGSAQAIRRVGVHWATEQCRDLLDHRASGIHFYTLNTSDATLEIYKTLGAGELRSAQRQHDARVLIMFLCLKKPLRPGH